jgi:uncharacterized membrane protein
LGNHDGALARCRNPPAQDEARIRPDGPRGCDAPLGTGPYILAVATVTLSWVFTHIVFAMCTSSMAKDSANGLRFPGDNRPDYWDFIYFSFVIGTTFQVSDVAVTNRWIRHSVSAHGVLSFFFNTAIFALTVNMAASMI